MTTTTPARRTAAAAALLLGLGLTSCGGDSGDAAPSAPQTARNGDVYNAADVRFASEMIPHHAQAVQMVVMTQGRPLSPEVRALADAVRQAQVPEVEAMSDWLVAWGEPVPETSIDHANAGHDMDDMDMGSADAMGDLPGMMSGADMQALQDAPDAEFEERWLEMMVEHHQGAVEMARTAQSEGEFAEAVELAESIEAAQQAEIRTMQALLDGS